MGRPRNFTRDGVLQKALPVFWKHGFADTSLQDLEQATGVNKSGLYTEFQGKEDLFVQSLRYYLATQERRELLTAEPLGWANIERFLKVAPCGLHGQKGCFSVNSIRELAILPPEAVEIISQSRARLKRLFAKNIEAEGGAMNPDTLAEMVLVFFTGLSMEQNLKTSRASLNRKADNFMSILRAL